MKITKSWAIVVRARPAEPAPYLDIHESVAADTFEEALSRVPALIAEKVSRYPDQVTKEHYAIYNIDFTGTILLPEDKK